MKVDACLIPCCPKLSNRPGTCLTTGRRFVAPHTIKSPTSDHVVGMMVVVRLTGVMVVNEVRLTVCRYLSNRLFDSLTKRDVPGF